jgi:hypothetical protein
MHETACFVDFYEYMKGCDISGLLDLEEFRTLLQRQIKKSITYQTKSWSTDYVCKPSQFISGKKSDFYSGNEEICNFECNYLKQTQNTDGTWNVTWNWDAFDEQWSISKNWWKSDIIIRNISFIEVIAKIEKRLQDCITMHEGEGQAGLVSCKPGRCLGKTVNN